MKTSLHTQTSAPNSATATSVSPLDPSGSSKTKFSKADLYQTVTDSIVAALEAGVKPWVCPWQRVPGMSGLPSNYATGTAYSNVENLHCIQRRTNRWFTSEWRDSLSRRDVRAIATG